jgi:hypothetical protein
VRHTKARALNASLTPSGSAVEDVAHSSCKSACWASGWRSATGGGQNAAARPHRSHLCVACGPSTSAPSLAGVVAVPLRFSVSTCCRRLCLPPALHDTSPTATSVCAADAPFDAHACPRAFLAADAASGCLLFSLLAFASFTASHTDFVSWFFRCSCWSRAVHLSSVSVCRALCAVLSCPVLSCPVLSCPVLSCPVLSCACACACACCPPLLCSVLLQEARCRCPSGDRGRGRGRGTAHGWHGCL